MKKTLKIILIIAIMILLTILGILLYNNYRIKHAKIEVETIDDLNIEVYSEIKLKDLIKNINGKLIKNKTIIPKELGEKEISFKYINDDNIKVSYSFKINVVDKTAPIVSEVNTINITEGYTGNIIDRFFCADNYDANPVCEIIGDYDLNTKGTYNVTFQASDSSNNVTEVPLTINVKEKNTNTQSIDPTITYFSEIKDTFKKDNTKIGIDVSKHQGDIDFEKVKEAGVEFALIRVGYGYDKEGKNILDEKFIQNIKGFNKVGIPVGVYYFSYAENKKEAQKQADWVLKQIKKYKIDLGVVFDWENWSTFRSYNLSLYHLNEIADTFIKRIENKGYNGILYSSKNYLKYAWYEENYKVWIAHYNETTNYENNYKLWQICDDGKIDGIKSSIDIDIMYN